MAILQGAEVVYLLSETGDRLLAAQGLGRHAAAGPLHGARQVPAGAAARRTSRAPRSAMSPTSGGPTDTLTTWSELAADLAAIREAGVAISEEEYEVGLVSIAVPVRWLDGPGTAAINVSLPAGRATPEFRERLTAGLLDAAREIDREMGVRADRDDAPR